MIMGAAAVAVAAALPVAASGAGSSLWLNKKRRQAPAWVDSIIDAIHDAYHADMSFVNYSGTHLIEMELQVNEDFATRMCVAHRCTLTLQIDHETKVLDVIKATVREPRESADDLQWLRPYFDDAGFHFGKPGYWAGHPSRRAKLL